MCFIIKIEFTRRKNVIKLWNRFIYKKKMFLFMFIKFIKRIITRKWFCIPHLYKCYSISSGSLTIYNLFIKLNVSMKRNKGLSL
jgi:hypothetical protein